MSLDSTYCFIINCSSNSYRAESFFKERETVLRRELPGHSEFIYIQKGDSILEIAREKALVYSHIIACGGDGTVNRVANAIIGTQAVMGVIPLGSGNDFAQNIGLYLNFEKDLQVFLGDQRTSVDVIKTEWGYFLNTFGIGVDGLTNYYSNNSPFKHGGLKYFWAGLRALFESEPFTVSVKTGESGTVFEGNAWMAAIANGKTEGGRYEISPDSVNHDGEIELILVKKVSKSRLVYEFIKLYLAILLKKV
ncbi:diacylglycerol/lipid kinase family protein [Gracilimonas halophila]|uniref:Diacylglycerol/lipid kinase family protein n=1 Tax=Gracilimonas halophila TaxID=1834464 RepID=A0ABW5JHN1_9BACT